MTDGHGQQDGHGHGHGHSHGPSAADALTAGARYRVRCRSPCYSVTYATVQVEPTEHTGCKEVIW